MADTDELLERLKLRGCDAGNAETETAILRAHLESFGIRRFADPDDYWSWGGSELGEKQGRRANKLRQPLVEGIATVAQVREFYDFIAYPKIAAVVHSMKADAIAQSGSFIDSMLPSKGAILDLGCSTGYLTMFYARQGSERQVVGLDFSKNSVRNARLQARQREIENVVFEDQDILRWRPATPFDVVCSSQMLGCLEAPEAAFGRVAGVLRDGGTLLCVEPIGTAPEAQKFVARATNAGLGLKYQRFLTFSDLGEGGAYPAFVFEKGSDTQAMDWESCYQGVREQLCR